MKNFPGQGYSYWYWGGYALSVPWSYSNIGWLLHYIWFTGTQVKKIMILYCLISLLSYLLLVWTSKTSFFTHIMSVDFWVSLNVHLFPVFKHELIRNIKYIPAVVASSVYKALCSCNNFQIMFSWYYLLIINKYL